MMDIGGARDSGTGVYSGTSAHCTDGIGESARVDDDDDQSAILTQIVSRPVTLVLPNSVLSGDTGSPTAGWSSPTARWSSLNADGTDDINTTMTVDGGDDDDEALVATQVVAVDQRRQVWSPIAAESIAISSADCSRVANTVADSFGCGTQSDRSTSVNDGLASGVNAIAGDCVSELELSLLPDTLGVGDGGTIGDGTPAGNQSHGGSMIGSTGSSDTVEQLAADDAEESQTDILTQIVAFDGGTSVSASNSMQDTSVTCIAGSDRSAVNHPTISPAGIESEDEEMIASQVKTSAAAFSGNRTGDVIVKDSEIDEEEMIATQLFPRDQNLLKRQYGFVPLDKDIEASYCIDTEDQDMMSTQLYDRSGTELDSVATAVKSGGAAQSESNMRSESDDEVTIGVSSCQKYVGGPGQATNIEVSTVHQPPCESEADAEDMFNDSCSNSRAKQKVSLLRQKKCSHKYLPLQAVEDISSGSETDLDDYIATTLVKDDSADGRCDIPRQTPAVSMGSMFCDSETDLEEMIGLSNISEDGRNINKTLDGSSLFRASSVPISSHHSNNSTEIDIAVDKKESINYEEMLSTKLYSSSANSDTNGGGCKVGMSNNLTNDEDLSTDDENVIHSELRTSLVNISPNKKVTSDKIITNDEESTDDEEMISTQFILSSKKTDSCKKESIGVNSNVHASGGGNVNRGDEFGSTEIKKSTIFSNNDSIDEEEMISTQFCSVANKSDSNSNGSSDTVRKSKIFTINEGESTDDEEMISTQFCQVMKKSDSSRNASGCIVGAVKRPTIDEGESTDDEEMISTQCCPVAEKDDSVRNEFSGANRNLKTSVDKGESTDDEEMISTQFCSFAKNDDSIRKEFSGANRNLKVSSVDKGESTDDEEMISTQFCSVAKNDDSIRKEFSGANRNLKVSSVDKRESTDDEEMISTQFCSVAKNDDSIRKEFSGANRNLKVSSVDKGESTDDEEMISTQFCSVATRVDRSRFESTAGNTKPRHSLTDSENPTDVEGVILTQLNIPSKKSDVSVKNYSDDGIMSKRLPSDLEVSTDDEEIISTQLYPGRSNSEESSNKLVALGSSLAVEYGETVSDEEMFVDHCDYESNSTGIDKKLEDETVKTFKIPFPLKQPKGDGNIRNGRLPKASASGDLTPITPRIDSTCSELTVNRSTKDEDENMATMSGLKPCTVTCEKSDHVETNIAQGSVSNKTTPIVHRGYILTSTSSSIETSQARSQFEANYPITNEESVLVENKNPGLQLSEKGTSPLSDGMFEEDNHNHPGELTQIQNFIGASSATCTGKNDIGANDGASVEDNVDLDEIGELTQIRQFIGSSDEASARRIDTHVSEGFSIDDGGHPEDAGELTQMQHCVGTAEKVHSDQMNIDTNGGILPNGSNQLDGGGELTQIQHFIGISDKVHSNKINTNTSGGDSMHEQSFLDDTGELTQIERFIGSSVNVVSSKADTGQNKSSQLEDAGELTQIQRFIDGSDRAVSTSNSNLRGGSVHKTPDLTDNHVKLSVNYVGESSQLPPTNCDLTSDSQASETGELTQIERFMSDSTVLSSVDCSVKRSIGTNGRSLFSTDDIEQSIRTDPGTIERSSSARFSPQKMVSTPRMSARGRRDGISATPVVSSLHDRRANSQSDDSDGDFLILATPEVVAALEHQRSSGHNSRDTGEGGARVFPASPWLEQKTECDPMSALTSSISSRRLFGGADAAGSAGTVSFVAMDVDSEDELPELEAVSDPERVGAAGYSNSNTVKTALNFFKSSSSGERSNSKSVSGGDRQLRSNTKPKLPDVIKKGSTADRGESSGARRSKRQRSGARLVSVAKRTRTANRDKSINNHSTSTVSTVLADSLSDAKGGETSANSSSNGVSLRSLSVPDSCTITSSINPVIKRPCWSTNRQRNSNRSVVITTAAATTTTTATVSSLVTRTSTRSLSAKSAVVSKNRTTTPTTLSAVPVSVSSSVPVPRSRRVLIDSGAHSRSLEQCHPTSSDGIHREHTVDQPRVGSNPGSVAVSTPVDSRATSCGSSSAGIRRSARLRRPAIHRKTPQTLDKPTVQSTVLTAVVQSSAEKNGSPDLSTVAVAGSTRSLNASKSNHKPTRKSTRRVMNESTAYSPGSSYGASTPVEVTISCSRLSEESPFTESEVTRPRRTTRAAKHSSRHSDASPKSADIPAAKSSHTPSSALPCADKNRSISKPTRSGSRLARTSVVPCSTSLAPSVSASPCSAPVCYGHRVMFTGCKNERDKQVVRLLGGRSVEKAVDCTVLVADSVRRTIKFLCALTLGRPIVTAQWLESSRRAGKWLDPWQYLTVDRAAEQRFDFSLSDSLRRACVRSGGGADSGLMAHWRVYATPSVRPPPLELKELVETASGVFLSSSTDVAHVRPSTSKHSTPRSASAMSSSRRQSSSSTSAAVVNTCSRQIDQLQLLAISCDQDRDSWKRLQQAGFQLVSSEAILSLLLRQHTDRFDISRYLLR